MSDNIFEVIIIGGSYAGLSAAMVLGRSIRKVLIIDSGNPCNKQTPYSHNFITHDGETPAAITHKAKEQVMAYPTISFMDGKVIHAEKRNELFDIETEKGQHFLAERLLFATGVSDQMPDIKGFAECWGISILHCPYCHGYEVRNAATAILGNGDLAWHLGMLLTNWTKDITLLTNGAAAFSATHLAALDEQNINIIEKDVSDIIHENGQIKQVYFKDGTIMPVSVMYAKVPFSQHCDVPEKLGCRLTEHGYIYIDDNHQTTVTGVYAAGDNTTLARVLTNAIGAGSRAGIAINTDLIIEKV
jgi:thioredoxin reductase